MNKHLTIFLLIFSTLLFAETISFTPSIKVIYKAEMKLGENLSKQQNFVLIGNDSNYYFAGAQHYLNDTKQYISSGVDTQAVSDYFQERIIKYNSNYTVLYTFADTKIGYQDADRTKWVLYGDTKVINGVKCQMAATNLYGRRWVAYFSKEYSQKIGPYKFSNLPGLIFEIYDTKKDYHFTAVKIEKFSNYFSFSSSSYNFFSKKNYLTAKYNLDYLGAGYPPMEGAMRKEYEGMMEKKKKMYNNPIEIRPLE